jgi:tetratricopeptide (TPR) repeat protein
MSLRSCHGSAAVILALAACTSSQAIHQAVPAPIEAQPDAPAPVDAAAPPPTFLPRRTLRPSQRDASRAPVSLTASDGTGLKLVSLTARAVVEEPLAFTELHLVFENPTDRRIEGRFEIEMPPNAAISRFAMLIGGHWQEGEVVERRAAQRAYEDFLHRKQDPALLENNAGNAFSARVFPIGPRERKQLIVSYSQELSNSAEPYRLLLRGLPELDDLDASVILHEPAAAPAGLTTSLATTTGSRRVIELKRRKWTPDQDLEVLDERGFAMMGLRHDNLAVARVAAVGATKAAPIGGLVVLFDTSASRALGFTAQVQRLRELLQALPEPLHEDFPLRIFSFDQAVHEVYSGPVRGLRPATLDALVDRGALGASDLAGALKQVGAALGPGHGVSRLLVISDGIATAGDTEANALQQAARALAERGIQRIDAIVDGGIQDAEVLRQISSAELPQRGVVIDARLTLAAVVHKLTSTTLPDFKVSVPGASWTWPETLQGLQPGDEALVYADLPASAKLRVVLTGADTIDVTVPTTPVARPLLERAWVGARIERLGSTRSALPPGDADKRAALQRQIVELSTRFRVLSDFTALLVLETEADYRRFGIDRNALSDILTIDASGLKQQRRPSPVIGPGQIAVGDASTEAPGVRPDMSAPNREDARPEADANKRAQMPDDGAAERARRLKDTSGPGKMDKDDGEGTIGLGNTGLIGRGGGGRSGSAYGRGSGAGSRRGDRIPTVRRAPVEVRGALNPDIIHRIVRAHINDVRYCYNQGLARDPNLRGRVAIRFTIDVWGKVRESAVHESALTDPAVGPCIAERIQRWAFPRPGGGEVIVTYPFVLELGDGAADSTEQPRRRPAEDDEDAPFKRPKVSPYTGEMKDIMKSLAGGNTAAALTRARAWRARDPGDVLALLALGEALEAAKQPGEAARAYGSIIDLFPSRADLRRYAGVRLERLQAGGGIELAIDTYAKAVAQRPDHPASHRLYAYALARAGRSAEALAAMIAGLGSAPVWSRFPGVDRMFREDIGILAAVRIAADPGAEKAVRAELSALGIPVATAPSLRFVLNWETDANDVDFHIVDGRGKRAWYSQQELASGGELFADVTTGYGPECFAIPGKPRAFPYTLSAHYYSRGPMGYGMGALAVLQHDGEGRLRFEGRPFVIMQDDAFVELGSVRGPLKK